MTRSFVIRKIEETDSTNRWLRDNGTDGMVVVADFQTAGRGCGTNKWESERGSNLTFSMMICPREVPAASQFIISMANALALKSALDEYVSDITIKWPNDIYWRNSKICGTLIETTLKGNSLKDCIIGTGMNVNQWHFHSDAPNPVSLCQLLGHETDCDELLQTVLRYMANYMAVMEEGDWERIRIEYRNSLYRLGESHPYIVDGVQRQCTMEGVTDDGRLLLLVQGDSVGTSQLRSFGFKEVKFVVNNNDKNKGL